MTSTTIRYPVEGDASSFKRSMAESRDALKQASGAMEEWTTKQQKASMRMESMHEEALKMNSAFKSASDETQKSAQAMRAFDSALGGPISKTKGLASALDLADVGFKNLAKSKAGFNMQTAGVVGAGLAIGTMLGNMANKFQVVRDTADKATAGLANFLAKMGVFETTSDQAAIANDPTFSERMAKSNEQALLRQLERQKAAGASLKDLQDAYGDRLPKAVDKWFETEKKAADARKKHMAEAKKDAEDLAREMKKLAEAEAQAMFNAGTLRGGMGGMGGAFSFGARAFQKADLFGVKGADPIQTLGVGPNFGNLLTKQFGSFAASSGKEFKLSFGKSIEGLGNVILGAIQGGGSVSGAIGAHLGGSLGTDLGKMLTGSISGSLGKMLGSLAGPLGSLLGGGLGNLVGGLFGGGEHAKVNDMRDEQLQLMGGWQKLHADLAAAGNAGLMQKIFDAKTISSFNSAMSEAQALLGMHNQALNERTAAAKEFGLVSQAQIEQDGIALLRKRELLLTEFSQGEVNKAMAEKMNEYVQATVQAGKLVPENFKPILEQMAAAGLLTDAAGNAVDSLADAGVTGFGELSDASKELVKSLKELVDLLRQSMGLGPVTVPGGGGGGQPVRAPGEAGPRLPHFAEGGYTTPGPERLAWVGSPSGEHHVTGDSVPRLADEIAARIGMGGQTIVIPVHVGTTKVDEVVAQMVRNGGPLRDEIDRRVNG